ncbi:DUF4360 domain-containing protein [Actinoplanes sp. NPDC049118]|uniref:DUF4360 domain-containing protein n=1 Tax=Actinoplanes sp. NPDC049118 TaxID=3155769 RepID=UPI0033E764CE
MVSAVALAGLITSLLAPTSPLAPAQAQAQAQAEVTLPDGVAVEVVAVNGSGCPAAEGTATVSPDGTLIEVEATAYLAWAGGAATPPDSRKNCQLSLHVTRPAGWTYAIVRASSSGFAYLPEGATGTTRISLYFQGMSPTTMLTTTFDAPMASTWRTADTVAPDRLTFAPCDTERNLNINTELRVKPGDDRSADVVMVREAVTSYRLTWVRC